MSNKKKRNVGPDRNTVKRVAPRSAKRAQSRMDSRLIAGLAIGAIVIVVAVIVILSNQPSATALPPQATSAVKQWSAYPPMTIDKTKTYTATFTMAKGGQFVVQLFPDKAPLAVNNFVFLVQQGYYSGVTFHRVLEGFMAQGGDPTGTGSGSPGYSFANEISDLKFDKAGVFAMANTGQPNSNGSQFFITFAPYPSGNGGYTIFGQVISGMDVVNGITLRNPDLNPSFKGDAIQSITVDEK